ncbi:hypothetical protein B0T24DRAFT_345332 [Lasiosphaeria ovina]|uniref:ABC transporter n=1 Tax=Lasiosphaeria ovina TaxID=92902 RepID=A0AAE0N2Y0_9PEZI|nr:hypothetical protein B0T24DRAFT_345332 [Lasiosphaeria ovina]
MSTIDAMHSISGWMWRPGQAAIETPLRVFASYPSNPPVEWIDKASRFARSGHCQLVLVVVLLLWTAAELIRRSEPGAPAVKAKGHKLRLAFEIASQVSRGSALAFIIVAAWSSTRQWFNVATLGYAFFLGLLRIVLKNKWRHVALHQVNLLLLSSLVLLVVGHLLPSLVVGSGYTATKVELGAIGCSTTAVLVALLTPREWVPPPIETPIHQKVPEPVPSTQETCSWFENFFTYGWVTPLIWKGYRNPIEMKDLPNLPWYDEPAILLSSIMEARARYSGTLRTVLYFQRRELTQMCVWTAISYSAELIAPFAMYQLLQYLSAPDDAILHPAIWLFLLFAGPVFRSVSFNRYIFISSRLGIRVKAAMTLELYHRALSSMELEDEALSQIVTGGAKDQPNKTTSAGRLANLMASDVTAISQAQHVVLAFVGIPISMIVTIAGLYKIIGWSSLVGTVFMLLVTPVPAWIAHTMGRMQRKVKQAQDSRISLIGEYLASIKPVKYFGWEGLMTSHITEVREKEQNLLWTVSVYNALFGQVTALIPVTSLLLIFGLYAGVLEQPLTASVAFTTLSLISNLSGNLGMINFVIRMVTEAFVSLGRLDRYFASTAPLSHFPTGPLRLENATFRRGTKSSFKLREISINFVEGGLNVVSGQSGSGKTSLLLAILGELILESGSATTPGDVAFASQTPWLQSETIRSNILFHAPFEQARYDRIVEACALAPDFSELQKGDQTEVGENGTALSGGQKSRVALARALYSKAPMLLLDDIFSALDAKTAASVWKLAFCGDMLQGRTIVLVTQLPWIASQADLSITLDGGTVTKTEQNLGVTRKPVTLESAHYLDADAGNGGTQNGETTVGDIKPQEPTSKPDEISEEMDATGASSRTAFFKYVQYYGGNRVNFTYAGFAFLTTLVTWSVFLYKSFWVSIWVDAYDGKEPVHVAYYIGIYAALSLSAQLTDGFSYLVYQLGSWRAARRLHTDLINAVMNAPLLWWKNVPVGRVVNRFSRDVASLDSGVGSMALWTVEELVQIFFRIGAVSSILPVFVFPALVTVIFGIVCGEMYTRTAVTVKRLASSSQSPVFSQFSDSMEGLAVIRARADMPETFQDLLAERHRPLSNVRGATFDLNRWVGLRTDFVTALVMLCAGVIAIFKANVLAAGLVGFSLINANGLSDAIIGFVRSVNYLEVELQSFHRVEEYTKIEPEEKTAAPGEGPDGLMLPSDWPRTGSVEFRNVSVKYDTDGPEILHDINLKISAGERVAIVGRTGSGKSTLVLSLLRFTQLVSGQILYDGVDIEAIPRRKLRQALTIIPQEAVLFNGTVGSNLDPSGTVPPAVLEDALLACKGIASFGQLGENHENGANGKPSSTLSPENGNGEAPTEETPLLLGNGTVSAQETNGEAEGGLSLSTTVQAKGENFSHGQRQVLSLCRALVRKTSKLMLLDEATASMDFETDRGVQEVLRKELKPASGERGDRTLVTIAHRLRTIIDYDKIVVMGSGRVLEVGSPRELYAIGEGGHFFEMVRHSGELDHLRQYLELAEA